ncbi:hypothetical protein ACFFHK_01710 [Gallibacterium trehalosifermentans]|uniref:Uncharacterized protein n=1 Tax=Gallibacterium trehalosifermentans TaxID=516935 RepID=A0ABV6GYH6_9PAST
MKKLKTLLNIALISLCPLSGINANAAIFIPFHDRGHLNNMVQNPEWKHFANHLAESFSLDEIKQGFLVEPITGKTIETKQEIVRVLQGYHVKPYYYTCVIGGTTETKTVGEIVGGSFLYQDNEMEYPIAFYITLQDLENYKIAKEELDECSIHYYE